ncbi:MASE4 domain-containing protein [Hansschlegelia sp. KR7-227]|uniref:MASE4 domain-containing protein n=1 Tax=Hansschlegelia sp. KR7-227 TaxID=3400914 RepID=UPI003C077585
MSQCLLTDRRPTRAQVRLAWAIAAVLLLAFAAALPFARVQLLGTEAALPAYAAAIFINDVLTAVLLLAVFSAQPTLGVLFLAIGYLVVGLLAVPWVLTFPGVFAERGLLDAGEQTTAVIAAIRRCGFPLFVLAYALLRGAPFPQPILPFWSSRRAIAGTAVAVCVVVIAATALIVARDQDMPKLMAGRMEASSLWNYVAGGSVALYVAAGVALLRRPRSVLDLWLLVVLFALLIEIVLLSFISSGRLSLGWWAGRGFGLAAASIVLLQMLWETTALYAHLARSLDVERRANEVRLTSLEALSASIAHELNQPLASMVTNADAGLLWLDRAQPELDECRGALARIVAEGHRAGDVIESVRTLFRKDARERVAVNMNDIVTGVLPEIRRYARLSGAVVQVDLAEDPPEVVGNDIQLRQVVANLAANALEAMSDVADRPATLMIRTAAHGSGDVLLSVADTGKGLGAKDAEGLFEPFVTSKPSGLGMGLMICRSIVEAHGGRISAVPNEPFGSVFSVALPVADLATPRSPADR